MHVAGSLIIQLTSSPPNNVLVRKRSTTKRRVTVFKISLIYTPFHPIGISKNKSWEMPPSCICTTLDSTLLSCRSNKYEGPSLSIISKEDPCQSLAPITLINWFCIMESRNAARCICCYCQVLFFAFSVWQPAKCQRPYSFTNPIPNMEISHLKPKLPFGQAPIYISFMWYLIFFPDNWHNL